jgi:uncharacterized protein (DUF1800 family)
MLTSSTDHLTLHILNRLSYGPKPGDLDHIQAIGIDAYIQEQLKPQKLAMPKELSRRIAQLPDFNQSPPSLLKKYARKPKSEANMTAAKEERKQAQPQALNSAIAARIWRATESPQQLQEVMTEFWFNHFNVFGRKGKIQLYLVDYELNAIQPHTLGNFRTLLGAIAKHPAMLIYLDNTNNKVIKNRKNQQAQTKNVNENYARELLELHTLGVDGGYSQADIIALARILTGWGVTQDKNQTATLVNPAGSYFRDDWHDFSDKQLLGQTIKGQGQAELEQALDLIAHHPSTARHISYKLAQWFVSDNPPPTLVKQLQQTFLTSNGNITTVLQTLFKSPSFLDPNTFNAKFKTPYQYIVSVIRAGDFTVTDPRKVNGWLNQLSMPLYGCLTPNGYDNTAQTWLNPDGLLRRLTLIEALPQNIATPDKPQRPLRASSPQMTSFTKEALQSTLGNMFTAQTQQVVAANSGTAQGGALHDRQPTLLLGSPEFMYQ